MKTRQQRQDLANGNIELMTLNTTDKTTKNNDLQEALREYASEILNNVTWTNFLFHQKSYQLATNIINNRISNFSAAYQIKELYEHKKSRYIFWRSKTHTKSIIDRNAVLDFTLIFSR